MLDVDYPIKELQTLSFFQTVQWTEFVNRLKLLATWKFYSFHN